MNNTSQTGYGSVNGLKMYYEIRDGGEALVFEVTPATVFGFGKGESFSQTRWRF